MNNPAIVGVPNTLIFKVCGKALDSSTTVTTTLVAGEPGERVITKVTVSDSLDRFGTCVLARVPWTPSLPGVVTITATLNGNRKVSEGIWIFNNYMAWPIVVSNGS